MQVLFYLMNRHPRKTAMLESSIGPGDKRLIWTFAYLSTIANSIFETNYIVLNAMMRLGQVARLQQWSKGGGAEKVFMRGFCFPPVILLPRLCPK